MSAQCECWPVEGPRADARVSRAAPQGQTTPMGRPEHREGASPTSRRMPAPGV